jgi:hypothetical protein
MGPKDSFLKGRATQKQRFSFQCGEQKYHSAICPHGFVLKGRRERGLNQTPFLAEGKGEVD